MSKIFTFLQGEGHHKGLGLDLIIHELISGEIELIEEEAEPVSLSLGNIAYILGYTPTRNFDTYETTAVAPEKVRYDEESGLYILEVAIPYLRGNEWVRVSPPDSEDACHDEYVRCQPLRREVQQGKVIVQMLKMPEKEFHIGLKIHDYVSFDEVEPEKTDMTKEQLKALLGGVLPTCNEEFNQKHTIEPESTEDKIICLSVENLLTTDVPDLDTADKLTPEEHTAWGKAGFSYDHHEDGKLYLKILGKVPSIPLHCFTRIQRSTEIGE